MLLQEVRLTTRIRGFPRGGSSYNLPQPKEYQTLKHKVEIYVPVNTREQEKVMSETFLLFCREFGGAMVNSVLAGWIMEDGTLVTDEIAIVYSYTDKIPLSIRKMLRHEAVRIAKVMKEEVIILVIDGGTLFITP